MSVPLHLYSHLRIHQVFGANTDVGKTLFTTALCLAETELLNGPGKQVHYLKPVSTGPPSTADAGHVKSHVPGLHRVATLIQYPDALSPHLAARKALGHDPSKIPSDHAVRAAISDWITDTAAATPATTPTAGATGSVLYLETAGGVHSPGPSGSSQAAILRPFRLPTILVGSPVLGGISATISAYESLILQGYDVDTILLLAEPEGSEKWGNAEYLAQWSREHSHRGLRLFTVGGPAVPQDPSAAAIWGPPPERGSKSVDEDREAMRAWYHGFVHGQPSRDASSPSSAKQGLSAVLLHLQQRHEVRLHELDNLAQRTRNVCWWPFTQHEQFKSNSDVTTIDSAHGDMFVSYSRPGTSGSGTQESLLSPLLDSSASWWTQCLGHADSRLALAAARAAARYGHVLFPGAANEPATRLSETLIGRSQHSALESNQSPVAPWAARVFFSDDGSTGTEVAFKMAIASAEARYSTSTGQPAETKPRTSHKESNASQDTSATGAAKAAAPATSSYQSAQTTVKRAPLTPAVIGLRGSYHGDTIGAMDASEPSVYNARVPWYTGKGAWLGAPVVRYKDGVATVEADFEAVDPHEWDAIQAELAQSSTSSSSSSPDPSIAWSRPYNSLQSIYDVRSRIKSDPLASMYQKHVSKLLRRIAAEHAVVGPDGSNGGYRFSALVLEPIILGAGGMRFVDPLFQRVLVDIVREEGEEIFGRWDDLPNLGGGGKGRRTPTSASYKEGDWRGLPVVFDEVFTGLYRLGHLSPSRALLDVNPDILVLAKILTGGLVPMSVTLASSSIFDTFTFAGSTKVDALLHGHSYTAHAVGCEVAQETLHILSKMEREGVWSAPQREWKDAAPASAPVKAAGDGKEATSSIWSFWSSKAVEQLSRSSRVRSTMALGTVLVVELVDQNGGYASSAATDILHTLRTQSVKDILAANPTHAHAQAAQADFNIHARPLGNILYFMCSLNSPPETLRSTEAALLALLA